MFLKSFIFMSVLSSFYTVISTSETIATLTTSAIDLSSLEKLPDTIPTCKADDLNISECLKSAFQELMPRLKDGLPELNLPPLDPLVLERSNFQYDDGLVQGHVALKNVHIYGMSNMIIDTVDFQLKNGHMSLEQLSHLPSLYVEGSYKADMKLNEVKMQPKGYFNISMTDIVFKAHPEGDIYERDNGHSYLNLTKFLVDPDVGDMKIYANGLFPDPTLNAIMLDFVNQYWHTIYKSILPATRSTWEPLIIEAANEFLSTLPIDLLLTKN